MAIEIPSKLKIPEVNFVLIEARGKKPFQADWQKKRVPFDDRLLINHLKGYGNYGVRGGGDKNLVIVDFDNLEVQEDAIKKLPETFTVKTGSGLLHKYYFSDKSDSFKVFTEEMDTIADIQGEGKQVVGPGSIHPNGNNYELIEDKEIAFIPYAELKAIMMSYDKKPKKEVKKFESTKNEKEDAFADMLQRRISMEEVLREFGVDTSKNPTNCSLHSSKGGKCLGFNYETAHCFHCEGSWNIFSFVMENKKCDFKGALEYLAKLGGLEKEYEESRRKWIENNLEEKDIEKKIILSKYLTLISGREKKWGEASELIVDYLKKKLFLYTTKEDLKSEIWVYKEGIYVPQGRSEIRQFMRDLLGISYNTYIYNLVLAKIEPDTFIDSEKFFNTNYIYEVPVKNGILNIREKKVSPFDPKKIFFNKLNVKFDPDKKCPQIDKFLTEVFASEGDKTLFYEYSGFCLMKEYVFEKAMMFLGNGRNGKDKTLELVKRLLDLDNCSAITLDDMQRDQYSVAGLFGKMVNIAGDISNQDLKDTSVFKALTGRSPITANRKFLSRLKFINYAKMIFACNELPTVYDNSIGFWDRWVVIEFPYTFVTKEEYDSAENKTNLKIRDEQIIEKIVTEEELSGFLNKLLEHLHLLLEKRSFTYSNNAGEVKNLWIRKSNSITAFCMDAIEESIGGKISKKVFRRNYVKYCKKHKIPTKSDTVIKRILQDMYGASEDRFRDLGMDNYEWFWTGIKFKSGGQNNNM